MTNPHEASIATARNYKELFESLNDWIRFEAIMREHQKELDVDDRAFEEEREINRAVEQDRDISVQPEDADGER